MRNPFSESVRFTSTPAARTKGLRCQICDGLKSRAGEANAAALFSKRGPTRQQVSTSSHRCLGTRRALKRSTPNLSQFARGFGIGLAQPIANMRGVRPSPSSPLGPISEAPDRKRVTLAGAASCDSRASREDHAGAASNTAPPVVPSYPAWAVTPTAPRRRPGSRARDGIAVPDLEDEGAHGESVADARLTLGKKRGVVACVIRLEPLFTIAEAAGILNVSQRTVRRLIDLRAMGVVRIGRSVRITSKEIEVLVTKGGTRR